MNNKKQCPICKEYYPQNSKICPNCLYKEPLKIELFFKIIFIVALIASGINIFHIKESLINNKTVSNINTKTENIQNREIIEIPLRKMSNLSYLTKDEIFQKRKEYVNSSKVFNIKDYNPNPDVYLIEDNLGWISSYEIAQYGVENSNDITKGNSRHSISINNPEVLISIITPNFRNKEKNENFSEFQNYFPTKLTWEKSKNTLAVRFNISDLYKSNPSAQYVPLFFDETNTRDMGYNWIYVSNYQNTSFVKSSKNMSNTIYPIKGFYHKGFACKKEEGCNNYSPRQEEMETIILDLPAYLKFKIWKKRPNSTNQKADMIYEMYFD